MLLGLRSRVFWKEKRKFVNKGQLFDPITIKTLGRGNWNACGYLLSPIYSMFTASERTSFDKLCAQTYTAKKIWNIWTMKIVGIFLFVFQVSTASRSREEHNECVNFIVPDLHACQKHGLSHLDSTFSQQCVQNNMCRKNFTTAVIQLEPFSSDLFPEIVDSILKVCVV